MITVIVPIYNAEKYIEECIQSVLRQDMADWELMLIDDGSTDGSADICKRYVSDPRIHYTYKENSGVTETRWMGIEQAAQDFITFLDADDVLLPTALSTLASATKQDVDIICFGMQSFVEQGELQAVSVYENGIVLSDRTELLKSILLGKILVCVWGGLYKREMLLQCKDIFCNGLRIGEDLMFNLAFSERFSPSVYVMQAKLYGYRTNPESVMRAVTQKRFEAVYSVMNYLDAFLKEHKLERALYKENAFRQLLLWSTFVFNSGNQYYDDKELRSRMRKLYFPAFRYLYTYLKVYLFLDFFVVKYSRKR